MFESSSAPALFHSMEIYKGTSPVCTVKKLCPECTWCLDKVPQSALEGSVDEITAPGNIVPLLGENLGIHFKIAMCIMQFLFK